MRAAAGAAQAALRRRAWYSLSAARIPCFPAAMECGLT